MTQPTGREMTVENCTESLRTGIYRVDGPTPRECMAFLKGHASRDTECQVLREQIDIVEATKDKELASLRGELKIQDEANDVLQKRLDEHIAAVAELAKGECDAEAAQEKAEKALSHHQESVRGLVEAAKVAKEFIEKVRPVNVGSDSDELFLLRALGACELLERALAIYHQTQGPV